MTSVEGLHYFNRVVTVDQVTIGNSKSSRSNVATYTKLFDLIRDLFASLPEAKARGFGAESFLSIHPMNVVRTVMGQVWWRLT